MLLKRTLHCLANGVSLNHRHHQCSYSSRMSESYFQPSDALLAAVTIVLEFHQFVQTKKDDDKFLLYFRRKSHGRFYFASALEI